MKNSFNKQVETEFTDFLVNQSIRFPKNETLKIDLHCHDHNSDVPDELIGRILGVPETWTPTQTVLNTARSNNCTAFTITNHNNARSCYELQSQGEDILVGAEFSCIVPDFKIGIHVLTYGFNKKQEEKLILLRKNIYKFLQYTHKHKLPTIWAHPLYNYKVKEEIPMEFYNKMMLVFNRFEVLNGQRDTWQNMLVKNWVEQITPEDIDKYALEYDVDLSLYSDNPYKKSISGGSDSHMGIFTGQTGTLLHIPGLKERLAQEKVSDLALEAIQKGNMAPYGTHQNSEKLLVAFMDYFMQIALYHKDAGLIRTLTHKGDSKTKLLAFLISNAFAELNRHKVTMRFIKVFHDNFSGKSSSKVQRFIVPKDYKPIFDDANRIADARKYKDEKMINEFSSVLNSISGRFNTLFFSRLNNKLKKLSENKASENIDWADVIKKIEIPSDLRTMFSEGAKNQKRIWQKTRSMTVFDITKFTDGLSFPLLASALLAGANFTSSKVLYNTRPLLNTFSEKLGRLKHPKRMLWLTDTFTDKNGVSSVLQEMHNEIKRRDLPIDILVCSNDIEPDDHLIVVKPLLEYTFPFYKEQALRIPQLQEIHNLFFDGEYDRLMCSTEGVMGLISVYLKNAFSVPASFYMHTDWISFARTTLKLDVQNTDRIRRLIRTFYGMFDSVFVLNSSHKKWLRSFEMGFPKNRIHKTAHWVDEIFQSQEKNKKEHFNITEDTPVLLFTGRLSKEKGVMDIPDIYEMTKEKIPNLKIVFAGTGPAEKELKELLPDAIFMGWVQKIKLPDLYSSADLLILPSRFDTFSLVVLEALSCGLPVIAYNSKGPKDIIEHEHCGYLAKGKNEMAKHIISHFTDESKHESFSKNAIGRAGKYNKEILFDSLLAKVGL
ncbi:MAG: glycosyltransferase [Bacteroidales bacterium]|nr:glycosyltransferase [Bacteroidales bacterium]MBN2819479.1 glycosyltransferase [Bacteroidales bacterium]